MRPTGLTLTLLLMLQASVITILLFFMRDLSEIRSRLSAIEVTARSGAVEISSREGLRETALKEERQKSQESIPVAGSTPRTEKVRRVSHRPEKARQSDQTGEKGTPASVQAPPDPNSLSSAWVLPYPPENRGRFIRFESFRPRMGADGKELLLFKEWTGERFRETAVPSAEVRWDVRE